MCERERKGIGEGVRLNRGREEKKRERKDVREEKKEGKIVESAFLVF